MLDKKVPHLAVLIDADNTSADITESLFREIAKYGVASTKRIYGDWTSTKLNGWKAVLLPHAITPIQQFSYTTGKNATDMAMVIDAMDLLYSNVFDGFCIVSSDSDFTRLASRIRENGLIVYGFGQNKTPAPFRKACDKFIYTENLGGNTHPTQTESSTVSKPADSKNSTNKKKQKKLKMDTKLMNLIRDAIDSNSDDQGWANLGLVGSYISRVSSDFDVKTYGFNKLSEFIRSIDLFEVKQIENQLKVCKRS